MADSTYTVLPGDTLTRIAAKLGLDWHDLAAWNGLAAPYLIRSGDVLRTTAPTPTPLPTPDPDADLRQVVAGLSVRQTALEGRVTALATRVTALEAPPAPAPDPGPQQPTGPGITAWQNLTGGTFSQRANSAPHGDLVSLPAGVFELADFADGQASNTVGAFDYGAQLTGRGLTGTGPGSTVVQLKPGSSTRKAAVPAGDGSGGPSQPTNDLYIVHVEGPGATLSGLTVRGTDQGHPYNGVHVETADSPVLENLTVESVPGTSSSNPGETFAIDLHRATGTATIRGLTITGGTGNLASAAGLGPNNCTAALDIDGLTATGLKFSAPVALWEQQGPVTIRGMVSRGNPRHLGAERLAAPVSIFDPVWDAPSSGHDVTYTPWAGHPAGSIAFHFTDASKLPGRKIVILTDDASVKPTVRVFVAGVEQPQADHIAWQGA